MSNQQQPDTTAIKARLAKATPGPWEVFEGEDLFTHEPDYCVIFREWSDKEGRWQEDSGELTLANAEFIAHAREDIPALLSRLEAVERRNGELELWLKAYDVAWAALLDIGARDNIHRGDWGVRCLYCDSVAKDEPYLNHDYANRVIEHEPGCPILVVKKAQADISAALSDSQEAPQAQQDNGD